jgi:hypothetical protein
MSEDLAWLLGYLWGDGSLSEHKHRMRFVDENKYNLEKAQRIISEQFGLSAEIYPYSDRKAFGLDIASVQLWKWLGKNGIVKYLDDTLDFIPSCIRQSAFTHIIAFIAGFLDADGSVVDNITGKYKNVIITQKPSRFTRHLQDVALAVGLHFNHSLNTHGENFQKNKAMVLLSLSANTLKSSADILGLYSNKIQRSNSSISIISQESASKAMILGKVLNVEPYEEMETYDVEVENSNWFYAGAVKSHNTASIVLESSCSGIHPSHSRRFLRRIQMNKHDNVYQWFKQTNPDACEESVWSANKTDDVVTFPIEVSEKTLLKQDLSAIQHLDIIKNTQKNWVAVGSTSTNKKNIHHSISCTVLVKDTEWNTVADYLYENRHDFTAVSLLADNGDKVYQQAPFEAMISDEDLAKFNKLKEAFKAVDYTKMFEEDDDTTLQQEMSCVGGVCMV